MDDAGEQHQESLTDLSKTFARVKDDFNVLREFVDPWPSVDAFKDGVALAAVYEETWDHYAALLTDSNGNAIPALISHQEYLHRLNDLVSRSREFEKTPEAKRDLDILAEVYAIRLHALTMVLKSYFFEFKVPEFRKEEIRIVYVKIVAQKLLDYIPSLTRTKRKLLMSRLRLIAEIVLVERKFFSKNSPLYREIRKRESNDQDEKTIRKDQGVGKHINGHLNDARIVRRDEYNFWQCLAEAYRSIVAQLNTSQDLPTI